MVAVDGGGRYVGLALLADAPQLAEQLGENVAAQVLAMAADYGHILFPATAHGKNAAPRVAARLVFFREEIATHQRGSPQHCKKVNGYR